MGCDANGMAADPAQAHAVRFFFLHEAHFVHIVS